MIEVGTDTYIAVDEADKYIAEHYLSTDERRLAWEKLSEADKGVCLRRAAAVIDSLPYPGAKCAKGQVMSFPRVIYACGCGSDDCEVPAAVKAAQAEEAFEYAAPGMSSAGHSAIVAGIKSKTYDRYSVTYATSESGVSTIDSAIVSSAARELLRPYTGGGVMFVDPVFMEGLTDRCDIYHVKEDSVPRGYGLKDRVVFVYPDEPAAANVKCHFNIGGSKLAIVQGEPMANYEALIQLDLPPGTDIKVNDKIVDKLTGCEYTAEMPRRLPDDHHIIVMVKRREEQEPLHG